LHLPAVCSTTVVWMSYILSSFDLQHNSSRPALFSIWQTLWLWWNFLLYRKHRNLWAHLYPHATAVSLTPYHAPLHSIQAALVPRPYLFIYLFIINLKTLSAIQTAQCQMIIWHRIMNWKVSDTKQWWPNLKVLYLNLPRGTGENRENVSHVAQQKFKPSEPQNRNEKVKRWGNFIFSLGT
jgi:hypothetical protein